MKKPLILPITALVLLFIGAVILFSGCVFEFTDTDLSGRVVNGRSTSSNPGLSGVLVTATDTTYSETFSATTDSNGNWSMAVSGGTEYNVTFSLSGYTIPSITVTLDSYSTGTSTVPAIPTSSPKPISYDFILVWDGSIDIDLYYTAPDSDTPDAHNTTFSNPYEDSYDNLSSKGFGPLNGGTNRSFIPASVNRSTEGMESINQQYSATYLVDTGINPTETASPSNNLNNDTHHWNGIAQVYIGTPSGNISTTGASLYIFYTDGLGTVTLKGVFHTPSLLEAEAGLGIARINIFNDFFQLVPLASIYPGGSGYFKGIENNIVNIGR